MALDVTLSAPDTHCTFGVLDFKKYEKTLCPLIDRAKKKSDLAAAEELRALLMGISDDERRAEALVHHERLFVAMQSRQWKRTAAGHLLEASCVPKPEVVPDLMGELGNASNFLYDWNEDHAEQIFEFLAFLSDRTLGWASSPDTWRAVLAPSELATSFDAIDALSPRELRRILIEAEDGGVYAEEEALAIGNWWEALRKSVRIAARTDDGLYVAVTELEP
jgi:hypothetical protein